MLLNICKNGRKDICMKKVLFTGGSGFVGKNIIPLLEKNYEIIAPSRKELNLTDTEAVRDYVTDGKFNIIIHSANPNPVKNAQCDIAGKMFEDSMRIFMNFYRVSSLCDKVLYLGSGAEFDKTLDMIDIKETDVRRSLPKEVYGCTKYIMNELAHTSENIYNLRLFACYGPYDHESKFITHCIRCCLNNEPITIRQNCYFDYIHVYDLVPIIEFAIENHLKYHDYNVASGKKYSLKEIAEKVKAAMGSSQPIIMLAEGWNKEYTADISRLATESGLTPHFITLDEGIKMQIDYEKSIWKKDC